MPPVQYRRRIAWPAATVTGIRLAYLAGVALTLLWAPTFDGPEGHLVQRTFDRWDSTWFVDIADKGYWKPQAAVFFPVYPLLVRGVAWVVGSTVLAGMLVSLAAAAGSAVLLERIARRHLGVEAARTAVVLLALYPFAFVFTAVYADALLLFFVLLAVDAAERGSNVVAGLAAAAAVDTKLFGVALIPTLVLILRRRSWPLVFVPIALGGWMFYLHRRFGDWLAFAHAERRYWGREPLSPHTFAQAARTIENEFANVLFHLPRTGHYGRFVQDAGVGVVNFAALVVAIWLTVVVWRRFGAAYASYSIVALAMVVGSPTLEEPLASLPRFLLTNFPLFLAGAALLEDRPRAREWTVIVLATLGGAAAVAFAHGAPLT